jgi:hypothetical protein
MTKTILAIVLVVAALGWIELSRGRELARGRAAGSIRLIARVVASANDTAHSDTICRELSADEYRDYDLIRLFVNELRSGQSDPVLFTNRVLGWLDGMPIGR